MRGSINIASRRMKARLKTCLLYASLALNLAGALTAWKLF
jgi:hypothetical protein